MVAQAQAQAQAQAAYPELTFEAGSLLHLPQVADRFGGVLLWYSLIHLPSDDLAQATRWRRTADALSGALAHVGAVEQARLVRRGTQAHEQEVQAVLLAAFPESSRGVSASSSLPS